MKTMNNLLWGILGLGFVLIFLFVAFVALVWFVEMWSGGGTGEHAAAGCFVGAHYSC